MYYSATTPPDDCPACGKAMPKSARSHFEKHVADGTMYRTDDTTVVSRSRMRRDASTTHFSTLAHLVFYRVKGGV